MTIFIQRYIITCTMVFSVQLGSLHAQSVVTPPHDTTGLIGGTAVFHCEVKFQEIKFMSWGFNLDTVYHFLYDRGYYTMSREKYMVTQVKTNFTLMVKNLEYGDAGQYVCRGISNQSVAVLTVLGKPELHSNVPNQEEGNLAVYTCKAKFGGPRERSVLKKNYPNFNIFHGSVPVNLRTRENEPKGSLDYYTITKIYTFNLEPAMDKETIKCEISSSRSDVAVSDSTTINVLYSARNISLTPELEKYSVGMVIQCMADGNPPPSFQWEDSKTERRLAGHSLQITDDMVGLNAWKCTAANTVNGRSHQYSVQVVFDAVCGEGQSMYSAIVLGTMVPLIAIVVALIVGAVYRMHRRPEVDGSDNLKKDVTEISPASETFSLLAKKPRQQEDVEEKTKVAILQKPEELPNPEKVPLLLGRKLTISEGHNGVDQNKAGSSDTVDAKGSHSLDANAKQSNPEGTTDIDGERKDESLEKIDVNSDSPDESNDDTEEVTDGPFQIPHVSSSISCQMLNIFTVVAQVHREHSENQIDKNNELTTPVKSPNLTNRQHLLLQNRQSGSMPVLGFETSKECPAQVQPFEATLKEKICKLQNKNSNSCNWDKDVIVQTRF